MERSYRPWVPIAPKKHAVAPFMGHDVRIIPVTAELTTQEAAYILNVSRPFLVQLLERGDIPYHKAGTHRRVCYEHLIAYKNSTEAEQHKAMDALVAQAQELGMGYDLINSLL